MKRIVIAGNPNAGKSTLFNALTGKARKVGNWHGVTVDSETAEFTFNNEDFSVTDLPGLYTLKGSSAEEKNAEDFLLKRNYDLILVVADAKCFLRSVRLIEELKKFNKPIILFLNFYAEFIKRGGKIDVDKAIKETGVSVVFGEALKSADVNKLKNEFLKNTPINNNLSLSSNITCFTPVSNKALYGKLLSVSYFSFFIYFFIIFTSFYLAFGSYGIGVFLSEKTELLFDKIVIPFFHAVLKGKCSEFIELLVTDGIIYSLSQILAFIPQIAVLELCLDIFDQSGLLSRLSVETDGIMNKVGLSGKSIYALASGYGCTAISSVTSIGIDDDAVKKRTVLSLPSVSCSARTPVYMFFAKACFKRYAFLVIFGIYLLSAICCVLHSFILYKLFLKTSPKPLITEIAELRIPKFTNIKKSLLNTLKQFIIKLGTVLFIITVTLWLISHITVNFKFTKDDVETSLLKTFGEHLVFLFKPIGIEDWRYSVAVISGLFAKEGIAGSLAVLFPSGILLDFRKGLALTVFTYAYTPCLTALGAMKQQIGFKLTFISAVYHFLIALLSCYFTYFITGVL